jgi:hypothetical protein
VPLWIQVALFVLVFDGILVLGIKYEYQTITKKRPYDWSSDPNWLSATLALVVLSYLFFRH